MRETLPIFLLLTILNKTWILQVRKKVELTLNFSIVKEMNYDGDRCYDFAHTILQKHVKDLATKLNKRYLHRFGIKLLTKMPKNGICPTDGGKICINHAQFDADLKATHALNVILINYPN